MSEIDNRVTLTVNNMEYGGWKSVEITADLERQFRTFKLDITWQWPGRRWISGSNRVTRAK